MINDGDEQNGAVGTRARTAAWVGVGLVGALLTLFATRHGVGVGGPDSVVYLGIATNLRHGHGVSMPFTIPTAPYSPAESVRLVGHVPVSHFPPLYPIALWSIALLGVKLSTAARLLNVVLAGLGAGLLGALARRCTGSLAVGCVAGLLMFAAPVQHNPLGFSYTWLALHSLELSEPLFFALTALALLLLLRALHTPTPRNVALAAAGAGVATLVRLVGLSLVITGLAAVLVFAGEWRQRRRLTALFAVVGFAPIAVWALWVSAVQRGGSVREIGLHTVPVGPIVDVAEAWFMPLGWPAPLRHVLGVVALSVVATAAVRCRRRDRTTMQVLVTLSVFVVVYVTAIVATRDFLDISTPIDARILMPAQPIAYIAVITAMMSLVGGDADVRRRRPASAWVGIALCGVLAVSGASTAADFLAHGLGRSTPLASMALVHRVEPSTLLATNDPYDVFLTGDRASIVLPSRTSWTSGAANPHFDDDLASLIALLRARRGAVVLAPVNFATTRLANEGELVRGGLHVVARSSDGGALLVP